MERKWTNPCGLLHPSISKWFRECPDHRARLVITKMINPNSHFSRYSQLHKYSVAISHVELPRSPEEGRLSHPTFANSTLPFVKFIRPIVSCNPTVALWDEEIQMPGCQCGVMAIEGENQAETQTLWQAHSSFCHIIDPSSGTWISGFSPS